MLALFVMISHSPKRTHPGTSTDSSHSAARYSNSSWNFHIQATNRLGLGIDPSGWDTPRQGGFPKHPHSQRMDPNSTHQHFHMHVHSEYTLFGPSIPDIPPGFPSFSHAYNQPAPPASSQRSNGMWHSKSAEALWPHTNLHKKPAQRSADLLQSNHPPVAYSRSTDHSSFSHRHRNQSSYESLPSLIYSQKASPAWSWSDSFDSRLNTPNLHTIESPALHSSDHFQPHTLNDYLNLKLITRFVLPAHVHVSVEGETLVFRNLAGLYEPIIRRPIRRQASSTHLATQHSITSTRGRIRLIEPFNPQDFATSLIKCTSCHLSKPSENFIRSTCRKCECMQDRHVTRRSRRMF